MRNYCLGDVTIALKITMVCLHNSDGEDNGLRLTCTNMLNERNINNGNETLRHKCYQKGHLRKTNEKNNNISWFSSFFLLFSLVGRRGERGGGGVEEEDEPLALAEVITVTGQ